MKHIKTYENVVWILKPFFNAIEYDAENDENFQKVKNYLLDKKVDINCKCILFNDGIEYTPLIRSITLHKYPKYIYAKKLAFFFINNGADVNLPDNRKITPLMIAANDGDASIVKKLISVGAKLDEQDKWGNTAFMHAFDTIHGTQINAVCELVNAGVDWFIKNNNGDYPYKKLPSYWKKVIAEKYPEQYNKVLMQLNMNQFNL